MPEPSIGESFRQLGRDISGAMTAPIEARLRALSIKRGLAKEEEQAAALRKATEVLGEEAGTLLRAGVPPASIPALLEMRQINEFAYLDKTAFNPTKRIDEDNTRKMMRSLESVVAKTDDPTKLDGAMDSANANFNAVKKVADFMADNENLFKESYFGKTAYVEQPKLKTGDKKKDSEFLSSIRNKMLQEREGKFKGQISSWLNNPEKTYGLDLSGIPSIERAGTFMTISIEKGALNREDAIEVLNTESTEDLFKIANSKDEPEAKRIFAGYAASAYLTYELATAATKKPEKIRFGDELFLQNMRTGKFDKLSSEEITAIKEEKEAEKARKDQEKILRDLKATDEKRMKEIQTELSKSTNTILRSDPPKIELQKLENRANIYVNRGEIIPEIEINKLGNFIEERAATFETKAGKALGEFVTTEGEIQINKAQSLMEFIIQYNTQVGKGASPESGISEREPVFQPALQIPPPTWTKDQIKRSSADKLIRDGKVTEEQLRETYDIVP